MVGSFATGKKDYVELRIRRSSGGFHVQGKGVKSNRPYGVSSNIGTIGSGLQTWVGSQPHPNKSLAGTEQKYADAQASIRGSSIHFQIKGKKPSSTVASSIRRGYGVAFDVPIKGNSSLATFVKNSENIKKVVEDTGGTCTCPECTSDNFAVINGVKFNLIKA